MDHFDRLEIISEDKIQVLSDICWMQQEKIEYLEKQIELLREELKTSIECVYKNIESRL